MSAPMVSDGRVELLAAGWAMMSPRLNLFKSFVAKNNPNVLIHGIVFPKRQTLELDGIPILEPEEVATAWPQADLAPTWVCTTINKALKKQLEDFALARGFRFVDCNIFLRDVIAGGTSTGLRLPFDNLTQSEYRTFLLNPPDTGADASRLFGIASIDLLRRLQSIFHTCCWEKFYDLSTDFTMEQILLDRFSGFVERGARCFRVTDEMGVAIQIALRIRGSYPVNSMRLSVSPVTATVSKSHMELQKICWGQDISVDADNFWQLRKDEEIVLYADGLPALTEQLDAAAAAGAKNVHFVVPLKRSIFDLQTLIKYLDAARWQHRLTLEQKSASPDSLIATGYCV